ncbi:indolepyruvate ferredoxin oxidoreductase family protein [Thauera linaloolentis]|uniref:Indolepyruvate ferredoxin oxidoreductase n=1 Tax=Thauera linaloolentis (strain DSM 12138 / JCM 21573 / CCUG 41526 / CIP 105981 / IAM 15112 / NBRC 102519 / 47Lol) TaxID=1123367 RepID=N6Y8M5_THAL4|nr:indolepyruvate ferredoxin oxidoreductase family protein [Thauera linaloolentis]ENO90666.1 indolepyruvate ferredoxin oxidoreductase [Thauera linaloolentis 47Lol = DSM 12138]MCM8565574.1 indolepyruvate ferredoxin oxidoreductase family protein [Thauera linaloolentis]
MAERDPRPKAPSLDDKYTAASGRVYLTGYQALVRLLMIQKSRDEAAGLDTAGFVSGYRGSPLGGLDQTLWKARRHLEERGIVFQPGVNEDLAATAVWGSQQVQLSPGARHDGVFAMWYGKGPGVDRCGDVFRHANAAGSARFGGVLVVAGDDHAAKSSTLPHQTDHFFKSMMMPVLAPAGVQQYIDFGVHGYALSRYSGCWVAFKALADTVETSASVDVDPQRVRVAMPTDFALPADGLNLRWPDPPLVQEKRLLHYKLYAALAYARANHLNQIVIDSPAPRLGIITSGKSYLDVRQALDDLGIDAALAAQIGLRVYKVGMVWPLEADGVRSFAEGLDEILVVEEKRQLLEYQLKEELYNWREDVRPRVVGKFDEKGEWAHVLRADGTIDHGDWLLPAAGELTPAMIARAIALRIGRFVTSERIEARVAFLQAKERALSQRSFDADRIPTFCSGCPHNTSTHVPEGSRALAGIGCHYMVTWMPERRTATFTHMGGEGVPWVGQAPFTDERHVFANLGDGTYFHSGLMAIRQSVAARVNITYKILYNDAVAMTGGQPHDGPLDVPTIVRQLQAEGVHNIVVVTDGTERAYGPADLPHVPIRHRDELDAVQRELRASGGVTALIYDQTCAAEKRRRRKRGTYPDPARRVFINEAVCEGCGDCGEQSNCMSILPVETDLGRKRRIDQSSCNKDYACLKGFCPSFVTIEGGGLRKGQALAGDESRLPPPPAPHVPSTATPFGILVTGVGGTGVVTIGALIGMAAHLDGKGVTVLDMTGLAQKGGSVFSHIRIADRPDALHAVRIAAGEADAVIGGDLIVSASVEALAKMAAGRSRAVINTAETPTAAFAHDPDWRFPQERMIATVRGATSPDSDFIDAQRLAQALLGEGIAVNPLLLGFAWQRGLIPVSESALMQAIELNGAAIDMNKRAFLWGRRAAHDLAAVERFLAPAGTPASVPAPGLDALVERRAAMLADYQDAAYADRYRSLVQRVREAETHRVGAGSTRLAEAVARSYARLLAYKDEYEVARLYTDPAFWRQLESTFEGDYTVRFHLAVPLLARPDPVTGRRAKRSFGPGMLRIFRQLARFKGLRGTRWDPFGYTAERRAERALIAQFETDVDELLCTLSFDRLPLAIQIAALPERIRGFGHVKARNMAWAAKQRGELLAQWRAAPASPPPREPAGMPPRKVAA